MNSMNLSTNRRLPVKIAIASVLFILLLPGKLAAQVPDPERDQLLNGLRVLIWSRPGDQNVLLKIRIHSGAVFDTAGKAGTMALLGDILFPDATTRDFFREEMGGRLEVRTDYDEIEITALGRSDNFDRIVDILRAGLVTTPITPENLTKVRDARVKEIKNAVPTPGDLADEAIRKRLLGSFPYSRPVDGTLESLGRIERGDLMLARERFLNANNATLTIIGGVDHGRAMRALQQLLGAWNKSTQLVPASFRQPDPPDPSTLTVELTDAQKAEVRVAVRGVSRSDPDYAAAMVLASVAQVRWRKIASDQDRSSFFVRHEGHLLPGLFVVGASVNTADASRTVTEAEQLLKSLVSSPVSAAEFDSAKSELPALPGPQAPPEAIANAFLDIDTFGLLPISDQLRSRAQLSVADVQRVAGRLFRDPQTAAVTLGSFKRISEKTAVPAVQLPPKKPGR